MLQHNCGCTHCGMTTSESTCRKKYLEGKEFGRQRIRQNDKRQAKQLCGIALLKINTDTQNGQSITCQVEGGDYLGEMSRMPSLRKVKRKICRYCKKKKKHHWG